MTHKKEQQIKIEGEFKPTVDCLCATRRRFVFIHKGIDATSNAVMEYKIEELTREVRKHNGFAEKIPVIQRDIQVLNHRMTDIETHEHERS